MLKSSDPNMKRRVVYLLAEKWLDKSDKLNLFYHKSPITDFKTQIQQDILTTVLNGKKKNFLC